MYTYRNRIYILEDWASAMLKMKLADKKKKKKKKKKNTETINTH